MTSSAAAPQALPQPAPLLDVLTRISDPAIPGRDKLNLVEGATDSDATALDAFTTALRDNQLAPLTFSVTGIVASDREPGLVSADVTITPSGPDAAPFAFPMEFRGVDNTWQLSRHTADLLLAYGQ